MGEPPEAGKDRAGGPAFERCPGGRTDGGAEDEITLKRNRKGFEKINLIQRVLTGISKRNIETTIFGEQIQLPVILAPVGLTRLVSRYGELAVAKAAERYLALQQSDGDFYRHFSCLLGYNIVGDPRPPINQLIERANQSEKSILSLDLPSGLNATTGKPGNPCIKASYTLTLALPKTGLKTKKGREFVGELFLTDIGIPPEIYNEIGFDVGHIFEKERIIKISG